MENEQQHSLFELNLDSTAKASLRTASQWAKVLAILGFVTAILTIVIGLIVYLRMTTPFSSGGNSAPYRRSAMRSLIICLLIGAIFITGSAFMLAFANRMSNGLHTPDQRSINDGLASMKNVIIFWTIISLFIVVLLALSLIGVASL
jgi:uncharacterized membrane protein